MRSSPNSRRLTLEDAVEIWRRRWLGEAQHSIAAGFGVNPGRVAEVLAEKTFSKAKKIALKGRAD